VPVFGRFVAVLFLTGLSACASGNLGTLQTLQASTSTSLQTDVSPAAAAVTLRNGAAKPPSGYDGFCARYTDQCTAPADAPREVTLTDDLWVTLEHVNAAFNQSIVAEDDRSHFGAGEYWTIPDDGRGDCEDYVVAKRQALIRLGLPQPALRIAVVLAPNFVRHAVLTVATDRGNYVLDNLRNQIVTWDKTGYVFLERQDPNSPSGWVSLD